MPFDYFDEDEIDCDEMPKGMPLNPSADPGYRSEWEAEEREEEAIPLEIRRARADAIEAKRLEQHKERMAKINGVGEINGSAGDYI